MLGSCAEPDVCGGMSMLDHCWCDNFCRNKLDCCHDFEDICLETHNNNNNNMDDDNNNNNSSSAAGASPQRQEEEEEEE